MYGRQVMNIETLKDAAQLAERLQRVFVLTADADGIPHMAAAGAMKLADGNCVQVSEWFCPGTITNMDVNPRVSLVVWDAEADCGFQLIGSSENIEDLAIVDGGPLPGEGEPRVPQVERRVTVRVNRILSFRQAPHSDLDL
jgi:uncharacterized protein